MTSSDTTGSDKLPQLPDRYVVLKGLGSGGMSQVFLATDSLLLKDVAIKVLHFNTQSHPQQLMRFQREAKITGQLKHRNIVGIKDFGMTSSGQPYIVMENIPGESLSDIIERIGPIAMSDAMPVMFEILDAVEFAHAHGVLHRDLKPSNIIVNQAEDQFDVVKLIDFGIAKLADPDQSLTGSGKVFGSPAYMSPEQARGKNIDARSEVYSLGCLFYTILAGRPPFEAESAFEVLNLHTSAEPPLLIDVQPGLHFFEEIQSLISKCLEKDPEQRFQSVAELSRQLRLLDDIHRKRPVIETERAAAGSVFRLAECSDKRNRKFAAILSVSVIAAIGLLVLVGLQIIHQSKTATTTIQPDSRQELDELKKDFHLDKKFKLTIDGAERTLMSTLPQMTSDLDLKEIGNVQYEKLKLRDHSIDGSGLQYIHNPNLHHLDLSNVMLSDRGWKELSKQKSVRVLDLEGVPIDNDHVKYLLPLNNLAILNIQLNRGLDRTGYAMLAKIPSLKSVSLSGNSISTPPELKIPEGAVEELVKNPGFTGLAFTGCKVSPADIRPLRSKTSFALNFDSIDLNQTPLLDEISKLNLDQFSVSNAVFTRESLMSLTRLRTREIILIECHGLTKRDRDDFRKLYSPRKITFVVQVNSALTLREP